MKQLVFEDRLAGRIVLLRGVEVSDAAFVLKLRLDGTKNWFIHKVEDDLAAQEKWISQQRRRAGDYYFLVADRQGKPCGLASLYNPDAGERSAEFGRWVSLGNAAVNLETVFLILDFAFLNQRLDRVYTRTVKENTSVVNFWKRIGAGFSRQYSEDGFVLCEYVITREKYRDEIRPGIERILSKIHF